MKAQFSAKANYFAKDLSCKFIKPSREKKKFLKKVSKRLNRKARKQISWN